MKEPPDIAAARAVFVKAMKQPEDRDTYALDTNKPVPGVPHDEADAFAKQLLTTCNICSHSNLMLCIDFIKKHIIKFIPRRLAFTNYLVTLSKSFGPREVKKRADSLNDDDYLEGLAKSRNGQTQQPPEPAMKRVHVFFILYEAICEPYDDVIGGLTLEDNFGENLQREDTVTRMFVIQDLDDWIQRDFVPKLSTLAELAANPCGNDSQSTLKVVEELLDRHDYHSRGIAIPTERFVQMRNNMSLAAETPWETLLINLAVDGGNRTEERKRQDKINRQGVLPKQHGVIDDPTAPWHELPAANGLYMKRTRGYPLRSDAFPEGGYLIQGGGQETDDELQKEVDDLYNEMLRCFEKDTNPDEVQDVDALGNIIWKDAERPTRNYWGFTLNGIDQRKQGEAMVARSTNGTSNGGSANGAAERARGLANGRGRGMGRGRWMGSRGQRGSLRA